MSGDPQQCTPAFQSGAFQGDAFQLCANVVAPEPPEQQPAKGGGGARRRGRVELAGRTTRSGQPVDPARLRPHSTAPDSDPAPAIAEDAAPPLPNALTSMLTQKPGSPELLKEIDRYAEDDEAILLLLA